jgi:glycosyltransferase involved in cell wall biosynthesis
MTQLKAATWPNITIVDSPIVQTFFEERGVKTHFLPYGTNFVDQPMELKSKFVDLGLECEQYVYFVGRFVPEKNIDRLINDYMQIDNPIKLVIIGKGISGETYESRIRVMAQNDERIIFPGPLYGDDYQNIIANSLGYVSASKLEGTSPSLLDALGARRKVLISDLAENKASLHNLGHYYSLDNKKESKETLNKFLNNELYTSEEFDEMMNFADRTYGWNHVVDKYLEIIGNKEDCIKKYQSSTF